MINELKSEFRKLLSVRSTYIVSGIAIALIIFFGFYVQGIKHGGEVVTSAFLAGTIMEVAGIVSTFVGLVAIFLMGHEFRYNTIVYTLTASNSHTKVILSKILAVMSYVLVMVILCDVLSIGMVYLGNSLAHHSLPAQNIVLWSFFLKTLVYCEGYALAGLLFATVIKNLNFAIAALFIGPTTIEALIGILLKDNRAYLPFTALQQVIASPARGGAEQALFSPVKGGVIYAIYITIAWLITWYLFVVRDAN